MTTALVVGASGFIGRALVSELALQPSMQVRAASRKESAALARVVPITLPDDFSALTSSDFDHLLNGVDVVYFLAAATPQHLARTAPKQRSKSLHDNANMPLAFAMAAKDRKVRRFVFVSSCGVHGETTTGRSAFTETTPFLSHDGYVASKISAEMALLDAGSNVPELTIVRPPMVYGPGFKGPARHILNFVKRGIPLPLGAVTTNRRKMIGLANLVDFLILAGSAKAAANQIFLVADNEELSTVDFIRLAGQACNRKPVLLPVPQNLLALVTRLAGVGTKTARVLGDYQIDDSKARKLLGWQAPHSVVDELVRTYGNLK